METSEVAKEVEKVLPVLKEEDKAVISSLHRLSLMAGMKVYELKALMEAELAKAKADYDVKAKALDDTALALMARLEVDAKTVILDLNTLGLRKR